MTASGSRGRVLLVATLDSHLDHFHLPFMRLLRSMGYEVDAAAAPSGFAGHIAAEGFHVYAVPFSHTPLDPRNVRAYRQLLALMRKRHYTLVHLNTPVAAFVGRLAAHRAGVPHVLYMAHGFHFHRDGRGLTNTLYFLLEWAAARLTTVIVTINRDDYVAAQRHFASRRTRIAYVPGVGADTQAFQPPTEEQRQQARQALGIAPDEVAIAWVGELNANKRPQDAVRLLALTHAQRAETILLLAGTGPQEQAVRALGRPLGDRLHVLGYVQGIGQVLQAADIFVNTSRREGLPLSIMEAMATGLPIVAYNIRGCSDLVADGVTGFLAAPRDVRAAADRVSLLADDVERRKTMGQAGRRRIQELFSLERVVPQMKRIYEEELGRGES